MTTSAPRDTSETITSGAERPPRVVAGVDCSSISVQVVRDADRMAGLLGARLDVVFAYEAPYSSWTWPVKVSGNRVQADMLTQVEATVVEALGVDGARRVLCHAVEGDAAGALIDIARGATLLVVGSHGAGAFTHLMLGSVATKCVMHATAPVYVVPSERHVRAVQQAGEHAPADQESAGRIVVGIDFSPESALALRLAARFARPTGRGIDAVATWRPPIYFGTVGAPCPMPLWDPRADYVAHLRSFVDDTLGAGHGDDVRLIAEEGYPEYRLVVRARRASMLLVGHRGRGGFHNLALGSVAAKCAHHAACPVVVVHAPGPQVPEPAAVDTPGVPVGVTG